MARRRRVRPASALESLSPLWILSQIILLQTAFYVVAAILFLFTTLVLGSKFSLDLVFSWVPLQADNAVGWTLAMVWVCNSLTKYAFPMPPFLCPPSFFGMNPETTEDCFYKNANVFAPE